MPSPALISQSSAPALDKILGVVDVLSETERAQLQGFETVIVGGWHTFVGVGLALAAIRDGRLYRDDFDSFEAYCRAKWEYDRHYVDRLISAAQVFTHLMTNSHQKPDHETQLRPLIGLTPAEAQVAWQCAVEMAGGRNITARLVKRAVHELQLTPATSQPGAKAPRQNKVEQRRLINDAIGQLLVLLGQKANHDLLTEKVEALHRHIQSLFATPPKPASTATNSCSLLLLLLANQMIEVIIIRLSSSRGDEAHFSPGPIENELPDVICYKPVFVLFVSRQAGGGGSAAHSKMRDPGSRAQETDRIMAGQNDKAAPG
jgi:hypothetical protein